MGYRELEDVLRARSDAFDLDVLFREELGQEIWVELRRLRYLQGDIPIHEHVDHAVHFDKGRTDPFGFLSSAEASDSGDIADLGARARLIPEARKLHVLRLQGGANLLLRHGCASLQRKRGTGSAHVEGVRNV